MLKTAALLVETLPYISAPFEEAEFPEKVQFETFAVAVVPVDPNPVLIEIAPPFPLGVATLPEKLQEVIVAVEPLPIDMAPP